MQNFTLGKKGLSMLFFTFILLIGSSPSFGQDCPTLSDTTPGNFCYLETIQDLTVATGATVSGGDVAWYRELNSVNPISNQEFLETNTYWAGNSSGTCGEDRIAVSVTVDGLDAPSTTFGNSFEPCEYGTADVSTVQDLMDLIVTDEPEFNVEVYDEEYSGTTLDPATQLLEGNSYFVGQRDPDGADCPSRRIAVSYDPVLAEAPTGIADQPFCGSPTVADLVAEATSPDTQAFRWYSTATSNPALSSSTPLVDGETYYASQIVNRNNSSLPPCESVDRFAVTVTVTNVITEETQRFCESIGEGNDFRKPEVQDLSPAGTWYADDTFTSALDQNEELIDGEDYFQNNPEDCEIIKVIVEFFPTPNAGSTTQVSFCSNDDPVNLVDHINDSQLGAPDQTGSFTPHLEDNIFDPAAFGPGTYSFTYTVPGNDDCPTDTSKITVTVEAAPIAGDPVEEEICSSDLDNTEALMERFALLMEGRDEGGVFDPSLESLFAKYELNPIGNFETTYTVGEEGECQDSAVISVTVIQGPFAGDDATVNLADEGNDPINLFERLGSDPDKGDPDTGGTWSPGNGIFDPETDTPGTFTYTVTSENGCDDSATVTVVADCPEPIAEIQRFCESIGEGNDFDRPRVANLTSELENPIWYADEELSEELDDQEFLVDGENYYSSEDGTCAAEVVTVEFFDTPNAGSTTSISFCVDDDAVNLVDFIRDSQIGPPSQEGHFSPELSTGTNIFDPSDYAVGTYNFRYIVEGNENCPTDESRITVIVEAGDVAEAGDGDDLEFCSNEEDKNLYSFLTSDANPDGFFENYEDGVFSPSEEGPGSYTIRYIVNEEASCVEGGSEDIAIFNIEVFQAPNAGPGADLDFCITEIEAMTPEEALAIFNTLIPEDGLDEGGEFSTPISTLIEQFTSNPIGEFSTTYTVSNENCSDSATYSITIEDAQEANAGPDVDDLVFCSTDADIDLNDHLHPDANPNGFFEELEDGMFSPSESGVGIYEFTYTVDSSSACVTNSHSATYTVEVIQGPDAGDPGSITLHVNAEPVNLFDSLNGNPDEGGTWTPGNINGDLDPSEYSVGEHEFTYTVTSENDCEDSATVTVTITDDEIICPDVTNNEQAFCESIGEGNDSRRPTVSDLLPANATWYATADSDEPLVSTTVLIDGEDYFAGNEDGTCPDRQSVVVILDDSPNAGATTQVTVCADAEPFDLLDEFRESILGPPDAGGTVTPALASGTTIFDPSVDTAGQYRYTVQSTNEICPDDFAFITINILINEDANAGDPFSLNFCTTDEDVNLFDFLDENVTMTGSFEGFPDGIFSPSAQGEGTIEVIYNVGEDLPCVAGSASATITITVSEKPDAPTADPEQAFCEGDDLTVADLVATGDDIVWYEDEALTIQAADTDALIEGEDYYAVATANGNACASEATKVTVTINAAVAPTLQPDGSEFCRNDNPTVQDLIDNLNGSGIQVYDSATGGSPLATSTALQDGITYYATATDPSVGCESVERLAVNVEVAFCGIPEGFSPNGDDINDEFVIEDIADDFPNYNIEFYNRWGNLVFKGNANTGDWDGFSNQSATLGDKVLPAGVYFYILNYNDGQTAPVQGKVYLSR